MTQGDESRLVPLGEALERCEDERARAAIAAAMANIEYERAQLPPQIAARADDPEIVEAWLQPNGVYLIEHRSRDIADLVAPRPAAYSRQSPALEALRRRRRDAERVKLAERSRALLARLAAGELRIYFYRVLTDPAAVAISPDRLRGAAIARQRGELLLRLADRSIGWRPMVAMAPAGAPSPPRRPSIAEIREAARAVYAEAAAAALPPPNLIEAESQVRRRIGAARGVIKPVLAEPEFAKQRLPRGRHWPRPG